MEEFSIKKIVIGVLALLPLLFSAAWLISVLTKSNTIIISQDGLMLSPVQNIKPIIIGLVLFMTGYIIFLLFIFSENIKRAFEGIGKKE